MGYAADMQFPFNAYTALQPDLAKIVDINSFQRDRVISDRVRV